MLSKSTVIRLSYCALASLIYSACEDDPIFFYYGPSRDAGDLAQFPDTAGDSAEDAGGIDSEAPDLATDLATDTPATDSGPGPGEPEEDTPETCGEDICGPGETCIDEVCECAPGYVLFGEECVVADPDNPLLRTADQMCERWTADYPERASRIFSPAGTCEPGTIDDTAHEDAMRRLNLYRWLSGVGPATVDWGNQALTQYAAVMFHENNSISHTPPSSWRCYSAQGAEAAGSSNIALGYESAAETVDGYVGDTGVPSLGHRRWCLHPGLGQVGFGHYGRGGAMWAFGSGGGGAVLPYVAYPPPGPVPTTIAEGEWSFSVTGGLRDPLVRITNETTGQETTPRLDVKASGYGLDTVGWTMPAEPRDGDRYRVYVRDDFGDVEWVTEFVRCR